MDKEQIEFDDNDEINLDFQKLLKDLLDFKWKIFLSSAILGIIGALYTLTVPNEYASTVKMLPEIDSKQMGGFSSLKSLAGLAGIDLNSSAATEAIRPDLYPNILESTPFLLATLEQKVFVAKKNKWIFVKDLIGKESIEAPINLFGKLDEEKDEKDELYLKHLPTQALSKEVVNIDKEKNAKIEDLKSRINAEIDKKSGVITINVKITDPVAAASIATYAQNYLTDYVTRYRTQKAKVDLEFLANRKREAKDQYDKALFNLSSYRDQNRNLFLNVARDQEKKLQYEVDIAYNLYSNLSSQLEEAKINVQQKIPVIKILEPAQVAVKKSEPKRLLITLGFAIFGLIISGGYVFVKSQNIF